MVELNLSALMIIFHAFLVRQTGSQLLTRTGFCLVLVTERWDRTDISQKISLILFTQICQNSKVHFKYGAAVYPQATVKAMFVDHDFRRWIEVS